MKMLKMLSPVLVIMLTMTLVSCGSWVDMPSSGMLSNKCSKKDVEKYEKAKNKSFAKMIFSGICKTAGKGEFADDVRCENGKFQVKCK